MKLSQALALPLAGFLLLPACNGDVVDQEWVDEYGVVGPFDPAVEAGKEDGVGALGPQVSWDDGAARVWEVKRAWADVTPEAGVAWEANSGLTWTEKYAAWVGSL
ncbi:MAG: hypothetical protein ACOCVR_04325, partial [Myxococcota bacterium]